MLLPAFVAKQAACAALRDALCALVEQNGDVARRPEALKVALVEFCLAAERTQVFARVKILNIIEELFHHFMVRSSV